MCNILFLFLQKCKTLVSGAREGVEPSVVPWCKCREKKEFINVMSPLRNSGHVRCARVGKMVVVCYKKGKMCADVCVCVCGGGGGNVCARVSIPVKVAMPLPMLQRPLRPPRALTRARDGTG
jgi:hypothetical protein